MSIGITTAYGEEAELVEKVSQQTGQLFTERRKGTRLTRREKLPWPVDKPFKILSLDGGGICGLYGATLLAQIEEKITNGVPVARYFDMIAGTSTGGIMALGLGLALPSATIEQLYRVDGEEIFRKSPLWRLPFMKCLTQIFAPLYNHEVLERVIKNNFRDATYGQSVTRLVIPAFMVPEAEIAVFKTDHHPDYQKDWRAPMWKVARATSAAPTFLGGLMSDGRMFLDGGVWANNPVMVAIVDALSAYDITREQIQVLSLGAGNAPFEISLNSARQGFWSWRSAIKAAMYLTTDNAQGQAGLLLGPENIVRLQPEGDAARLELDDWDGAVLQLPSLALLDFDERRGEIERFFQQEVEPRHRFYTQS